MWEGSSAGPSPGRLAATPCGTQGCWPVSRKLTGATPGLTLAQSWVTFCVRGKGGIDWFITSLLINIRSTQLHCGGGLILAVYICFFWGYRCRNVRGRSSADWQCRNSRWTLLPHRSWQLTHANQWTPKGKHPWSWMTHNLDSSTHWFSQSQRVIHLLVFPTVWNGHPHGNQTSGISMKGIFSRSPDQHRSLHFGENQPGRTMSTVTMASHTDMSVSATRWEAHLFSGLYPKQNY